MRILIAEDERITRSSLTRQLENLGHTVTATEDGQQALDAFTQGSFDIVITDWEMPQLSGIELITRIRGLSTAISSASHNSHASEASQHPVQTPPGSQAQSGYVYIIMLTSRNNKSDIVGGIEAGADDFVSKPFDREELRVRLLAGERVVRLERALHAQNATLREASDRMRSDLEAAARVQRAMLPREPVNTPRVRSAWIYVPTDELAGDAIGLHMMEDRYLVAYVVDVSGHGVPAALLAVTTMHALSPAVEGASLLHTPSNAPGVDSQSASPSHALTELNRRFCAGEHDGRYLTMILAVLDTFTGQLRTSRAGHPLPILMSQGVTVDVSDDGGLPIGIFDASEYADVIIQLKPGDRCLLLSDGVLEQSDSQGAGMYGEARIRAFVESSPTLPPNLLVQDAVNDLARWAGGRKFIDDVTIVAFDWLG